MQNMQWEDCYQRGHTPWDKGGASPPLLDLLADGRACGALRVASARVLVPGCGTGHDVRALAAAIPGAEVIGLDVSPTALVAAREAPAARNEDYLLGDLFTIGPEALPGGEPVDLVWEHTCFCAIDPIQRAAYVEAVAGLLVPGGALWGVFYLDPYDDEHHPGEGPPHGTSVEELHERFGARFAILEEWSPARTYPGREDREWMMRLQLER
jgi:SAM-dependent methyltransferase